MKTYLERIIHELTTIANKYNKSYDEVFEDYRALYKRKYNKELYVKKQGQYLNKKHYYNSRLPLKNISMHEFCSYYLPHKTVDLIDRIYKKEKGHKP